MRWIVLLMLSLMTPWSVVRADAAADLVPEDPLVVSFTVEGDAVVVTLETENGKTHVVRDTDPRWDQRLGELYLMHWPSDRRHEPAFVVQKKGVPPGTVKRAVDALKARGLKLVRLLTPE